LQSPAAIVAVVGALVCDDLMPDCHVPPYSDKTTRDRTTKSSLRLRGWPCSQDH